METQAQFLIILGTLLLVGLATHFVGRGTALPGVTLLVIFGILAGPSGLNLLPGLGREWFPTVANMALAMLSPLPTGAQVTIEGRIESTEHRADLNSRADASRIAGSATQGSGWGLC